MTYPDIGEAGRHFEFAMGLDYQIKEHLRATDPKKYEEYLRSRSTPELRNVETLAVFFINPETGKVECEKLESKAKEE